MNWNVFALVLTIIGTACWGVCFWWMYQISSKQNRLLHDLHQQNKRIEKLSEEEHKLIREVHPQISEINEKVEQVKESVQYGVESKKG